ncbi:ATP-binding cassette domain-containing protein [Bacillus sp. JCM 19041]|uniref:ATP-binding cassette domain-containing protein n=1 Tax=Bacillus sp. JCM 19041 TaxID=1460637 RepID=UPI0006D034DF
MLSCIGVHYRYEYSESDALYDVSLTIKKGERVALVGRNGSGKSTFAKLLNGLYSPTMGSISVQSMNNTDLRHEVGMVFQNPENQMVTSIVEDDLAFGLENRQLSRNEITKRIQIVSKKLGIVDLLERDSSQLSGGQKQRIALAGVLVMDPSVLVLDEVTSMLDPLGKEAVNELLNMIHEEGKTIISISHDVEEILSSDRVIGFLDGSVIFDGLPSELFALPEYVKQLGLTLPFTFELAHLLAKRGIVLEQDSYHSIEGLVGAIWKYSLKM